MKKYIQPSLHVVEIETENMLCLSLQNGQADNSEVLSRRKDDNIWSSNSPWNDDTEE